MWSEEISYVFLENSLEAVKVKCICRTIRTMLIIFAVEGEIKEDTLFFYIRDRKKV